MRYSILNQDGGVQLIWDSKEKQMWRVEERSAERIAGDLEGHSRDQGITSMEEVDTLPFKLDVEDANETRLWGGK